MSQTTIPTATVESVSTIAATPPISNTMLLSQVGSVLVGILLLIALLAWIIRKLGLTTHTHNNRLLKVVSTCQVGQRERVVIVEVDNNWLVLGVTPQNISPLLTLPAHPIDKSTNANKDKAADFRQLLSKVLKRPETSA
ncbi:flagellar biosynthetic protein FliO [Brenneria tiliae]|uniref:flagellar biosynthetic protein FliO n=1 Tax=Brenneria tiliae TaxID=2914984 RepID=UPI002014E0F1|nr:flagellar biosynthetic protein FliO [Brenneria tiliae]MCL2899830.1 flagellar biosynthetic protein FliO [Brenneria tiliae]MCL2904681.1 flagellar biosynthetic protein FliO [Brenneria tiliae]